MSNKFLTVFGGCVLAFANAVSAAQDDVPPADDIPFERPTKAAGSGMSIGENMNVNIPTPVLVLIFVAFLGVMAMIVRKILTSETEREAKKLARKAEKEARREKASSKKGGSKKAD